MTEFHSEVVPLRVEHETPFKVEMLDQRDLPHIEHWHIWETAEEVAQSISDMVIRGAPAIGIAAAYGVALGLQRTELGLANWTFDALKERFSKTRPTAVNLFWALERAEQIVNDGGNANAVFILAEKIMADDRENNLKMGVHGASLFDGKVNVLTHCNTGGLATGGYGTALGIIRTLHHQGKLENVWIDETRPYLQGARLTTWECLKDGMYGTLITDNMAGHFMAQGEVDAVIVGTDRVAANGDIANKIGTYTLAVLCKHHGIPFYVAAPISTIDPSTASGTEIVIEERHADEVTTVLGQKISPDIAVRHPAFDVTPAELITGIVTEEGVLGHPFSDAIATVMA